MNILALGAHPDDIEFGCAPVLIKEIKKGNSVHLLVLSRGEAGSSGTPEGRECESRNAAAKMGAALKFFPMEGDCLMRYLPKNSLRIAAKIRELRPQIVLAPDPGENQHPDHSIAGKLARDACRLARYGGLEALKPQPAHKVGNLYFYTITQPYYRPPDIVVDITDVVDDWEAAMNCHESQVSTKSYVELRKTAARQLGLTAGVGYATGLYANDPVLLNSLSDLTLSSRNF